MRGPLERDEWNSHWAKRERGEEHWAREDGALRQSNVMSTAFEEKPISNQETKPTYGSRRNSVVERLSQGQSTYTAAKHGGTGDIENNVMSKFSPSIRGTLLEKYIKESKNTTSPLQRSLSDANMQGMTPGKNKTHASEQVSKPYQVEAIAEETGRTAKDTLRTSRDNFAEPALGISSGAMNVRPEEKGVANISRNGPKAGEMNQDITSSRPASLVTTERAGQVLERSPLSERKNMGQVSRVNSPEKQRSGAVKQAELCRQTVRGSGKDLGTILREQEQFDKENLTPMHSFTNLQRKEGPFKDNLSWDKPQKAVEPAKAAVMHQTETFRDLNAEWALENPLDKTQQQEEVSRVNLSGYSGRESLGATGALRHAKELMKSNVELRSFENERLANENLLKASMQNLDKLKDFQRAIARVKTSNKACNQPTPCPTGYPTPTQTTYLGSFMMPTASRVLQHAEKTYSQARTVNNFELPDQSPLRGMLDRSKSPITPWMAGEDHTEMPSLIGMLGQTAYRGSRSPISHLAKNKSPKPNQILQERKQYVGNVALQNLPIRQSRGLASSEAESNQFGRGFFSFKEAPEEPSRRETGYNPLTELDNSSISHLFEGTSKSRGLSPINRLAPLKGVTSFSPMMTKQALRQVQNCHISPIIYEEEQQPLDSARDKAGSKHHSRAPWQANYSGLGYDELELTLKLHNKEDYTLKGNTTAVLEF